MPFDTDAGDRDRELAEMTLGVRYAATALVTDLMSGRDGPHIKWSATTTYEVVPLETDYANSIVTGLEELARVVGEYEGGQVTAEEFARAAHQADRELDRVFDG